MGIGLYLRIHDIPDLVFIFSESEHWLLKIRVFLHVPWSGYQMGTFWLFPESLGGEYSLGDVCYCMTGHKRSWCSWWHKALLPLTKNEVNILKKLYVIHCVLVSLAFPVPLRACSSLGVFYPCCSFAWNSLPDVSMIGSLAYFIFLLNYDIACLTLLCKADSSLELSGLFPSFSFWCSILLPDTS